MYTGYYTPHLFEILLGLKRRKNKQNDLIIHANVFECLVKVLSRS